MFLNQDYEGCVNELKRIDLSVVNEEIVKLQELADQKIMSFESLLILGAVVVVAAGLALWYFNKDAKSTDLNSDGKTDVNDLAVAVENAVTGVKAAADVNKDGKLEVINFCVFCV